MPYLRLKPLTAFLFSLPLLGGVSSAYAADMQPDLSHYKNYHDGAFTNLIIDKSTQLDGTYGYKVKANEDGVYLFTVTSDNDQAITISGSGLTVDALPVDADHPTPIPPQDWNMASSMFATDKNVVFDLPIRLNSGEYYPDSYAFVKRPKDDSAYGKNWLYDGEISKPLLSFQKDLTIVMPKTQFRNTPMGQPVVSVKREVTPNDVLFFQAIDFITVPSNFAFSNVCLKTEGNVYIKADGLIQLNAKRPDKTLDEPWSLSLEGPGKTIALDVRTLVADTYGGNIKINTKGGTRLLIYNTVYDDKTGKNYVMPASLFVKLFVNSGFDSTVYKWTGPRIRVQPL